MKNFLILVHFIYYFYFPIILKYHKIIILIIRYIINLYFSL